MRVGVGAGACSNPSVPHSVCRGKLKEHSHSKYSHSEQLERVRRSACSLSSTPRPAGLHEPEPHASARPASMSRRAAACSPAGRGRNSSSSARTGACSWTRLETAARCRLASSWAVASTPAAAATSTLSALTRSSSLFASSTCCSLRAACAAALALLSSPCSFWSVCPATRQAESDSTTLSTNVSSASRRRCDSRTTSGLPPYSTRKPLMSSMLAPGRPREVQPRQREERKSREDLNGKS